jgi:transcriptional regulator with XRE-family HTH domain
MPTATASTVTAHHDIGSALCYYRECAGLTRDQAAAHVGRSSQTIRQWEIGNRVPRRIFIALLAKLYKVDCAKLLTAAVSSDAETHPR